MLKAAGTGQAGQTKTGPFFSALGLVMIVNCIGRMVKIVTIERACSTLQPDDCQDLLCRSRNIAFPKVLVSLGSNSKVLLRFFKADSVSPRLSTTFFPAFTAPTP